VTEFIQPTHGVTRYANQIKASFLDQLHLKLPSAYLLKALYLGTSTTNLKLLTWVHKPPT